MAVFGLMVPLLVLALFSLFLLTVVSLKRILGLARQNVAPTKRLMGPVQILQNLPGQLKFKNVSMIFMDKLALSQIKPNRKMSESNVAHLPTDDRIVQQLKVVQNHCIQSSLYRGTKLTFKIEQNNPKGEPLLSL